MIWFALISLTMSPVQDGPVGHPPELYAPPVVRPFEPPSNFGRIVEEGDGEGDRRRAPIVAPVAVEAYRGSYEYRPSGADTAYDRGVANAEAAMDARMGPLDGLWKLVDDEGRVLFRLALSDAGDGRPVAGAYRKADDRQTLGPITDARRTDGGLVLLLDTARLALQPSLTGWAGTLTEGGRPRAVILTR